MRETLAAMVGQQSTFRGVVNRFGSRYNYRSPPTATVLLHQVTDMATCTVVADHLWLAVCPLLINLFLSKGDVVEFDATVTSYEKGYKGDNVKIIKPVEVDYWLSDITRARKVEGDP